MNQYLARNVGRDSDPRGWARDTSRWCWCKLYRPAILNGKIIWQRNEEGK